MSRSEICDDSCGSQLSYASDDEDYEYNDDGTESGPAFGLSEATTASSGLRPLGSVCTQCQGESHVPVADCEKVRQWVARRHQQETYPPEYVDFLAKCFIQDIAARFDIPSPEKAGVLCRRFRWNLDDICRNAARYRGEEIPEENGFAGENDGNTITTNNHSAGSVVPPAGDSDPFDKPFLQGHDDDYLTMPASESGFVSPPDPGNISHSMGIIEGLHATIDKLRQNRRLTLNRTVRFEGLDGVKIGDVYSGAYSGPVLGSGNRSIVRLATHIYSGVKYAVKCRTLGPYTTAYAKERLREEIIIMCQLDHPNIARLRAVYETPAEIFLVQEFCSGGDAFRLLRQKLVGCQYTEAKVKRWIRELVSAVEYVHSKGIMHGNLKLEKLGLSPSGEIGEASLKLLGFGHGSRFSDEDSGTEQYGAPHEAQLQIFRSDHDPGCDLWNIGAVAYLLLCETSSLRRIDVRDRLAAMRSALSESEDLFKDAEDWGEISNQAKNFVTALLVAQSEQRPKASSLQKHPWLRDLKGEAGQKNRGNFTDSGQSLESTRKTQQEPAKHKLDNPATTQKQIGSKYHRHGSALRFLCRFCCCLKAKSPRSQTPPQEEAEPRQATPPMSTVSAAEDPLQQIIEEPVALDAVPPANRPEPAQAESPHPQASGPKCAICFEEGILDSHMMQMDCGHSFCLDCWRGTFEAMLQEGLGAALLSSCPDPECTFSITPEYIGRIAPDLVPDFERRQGQSYAQANMGDLRWCPGADCGWIAIKPRRSLFEDNCENFLCGNCRTAFCFRCGGAPHKGGCQNVVALPVDPTNKARPNPANTTNRNGKKNKSAPSSNTEKKRIKACPKCAIDIEKIGGCNRMTCLCGHRFCWLCLGDMPGYAHRCAGQLPGLGQPNTVAVANPTVDLDYVRHALQGYHGALPQNAGNFILGMADLDRYAYYYNRYCAHDHGQKYAESQCPCLEERAINYTQIAGITTGTDTDFIRSANETLAISRRILKYAYCNEFFLPEKFQSLGAPALGRVHLERIERFTEELSEISEATFSRQDRYRSIELVGALMKAIDVFVDTMANLRPQD